MLFYNYVTAHLYLFILPNGILINVKQDHGMRTLNLPVLFFWAELTRNQIHWTIYLDGVDNRPNELWRNGTGRSFRRKMTTDNDYYFIICLRNCYECLPLQNWAPKHY